MAFPRAAFAAVVVALLSAVGGAAPVAAATVPASFTDTVVASLDSPTAIAFTPDGRMLVTSQFGQLRVVANGSLLGEPALDLSSSGICTDQEEGLLGVAVDPSFGANGYVYLYYTKGIGGGNCVNRVSRFTMSGDVLDPASELVLVDHIPAPGGYHNAGDLHFGKDGYLYVSVGDGGCDYLNDSGCGGSNDASRDQNVLVGKILRITSSGGIPPTNPFQGAGTARCNVNGLTTAGLKCQETFAWGLRNPFRIAFDPNAAGTRFYINDVGQNDWEEIDEGQAGADYGWNVREGPCANGSTTNCGPPPAGMTNPIYWYDHADSSCHAITGGAFVPNGVWPTSYDNTYIYGDYTCGKMFLLTPNGSGGFNRSQFADGAGAVVNLVFGPSAHGQSLYYTNYDNGGEVHRVDYVGSGNRAPTASVSASPIAGAVPLTVNFDGSGSSDPDAGDTLSYTWSFGDGTANVTTSSATTSHTYTTAGTYTASLTVKDNHGADSTPATVKIVPGDTPPQVTIDTPATSVRFAVGQNITLHGTATDAEDGAVPASSLTWRVIRHHASHTHPFLAPTAGNDVPIVGPQPEDLAAASNSYLEIFLTATDSKGVSTTVTRDLLPHKVDLTFGTSPTGLSVRLNGASYATPVTVTSWEAYGIDADAPTQTDGSAKTWTFQSWSDGGAAAHTITTPTSPASYTATFAEYTAPPGLVAAYGFGEGSGTTAGDASGNGNTGTLSGATWTTSGKYGNALSFNGTNSSVVVNDASELDLTNGMTLEGWAYPTGTLGTTWRTVLFKEQSGGVVYSLYANERTSHPAGQVYIGGERTVVGTSTLPLNTWTHLAVTFDGSALKLYVNGTLVATSAVSGSMAASNGPLRIGGNSVFGEWFSGRIDEVRVYNRALAASEIQSDMSTPIDTTPPSDTTPPTAPTDLTASPAPGRASLSWTSSTDNVGVTGYDVYRSTTASFTPSPSNRIAQTTGTTYPDTGLSARTYYYRVTAHDAAGNVSASSNEAAAVVPKDDPPTVSVTAPPNGASVAGTVTISATAADDFGVAGVQFEVDGTPIGSEDTTAPYSTSWNTTATPAGQHSITAVARDTSDQKAASAPVVVTITKPAPPPPSLVAAYSFDAGGGTTVADSSGRGNTGTLRAATWTAAGKYGRALSFNGTNSWMSVNDAPSLDLAGAMTLEAWVKPTGTLGSTARAVLVKERAGGRVYGLYANDAAARPKGVTFVGGVEQVTEGAATLPLGTWTHLAATYDGAALKLYVNGVPVSATAVPGAMPASTGPLRIGGDGVGGEWFSGTIDEVRVYNRALTPAQIEATMSARIP